MKLKTIQTILKHPLNINNKLSALTTFFRRGIATRIHSYPMVYPFIENTFLVIEKGMSSAELQVYTGLYDTNEMLFIMHFLRQEDMFVDVGANIGAYTVLASGVAGSKSIAFEPIPSTFANLARNTNYNNLQEKTRLINCGVGDKEGNITFTNSLDAINHVIQEENYTGSTISVPVDSLDNMLSGIPVQVIKIDVEGYEANVINGATRLLKNPELKVIIMETNGLTNQYEFGQNYLHDKILKLGFTPYAYDPYQRKLTRITNTNPENTIYIRDIDYVTLRVNEGRKIRVRNNLI
ncbi:FkbM family methyltransferase [Salmonirosea aquatica]|uniref:FkbM family methyltransferase n=1 Tax=Salmonirosea aquatica TaxID=2654236 RepID=A0A7C9BEG1_9BACT|nr:FkbM family methyltransferase [Cytophagaceae bacterium SJW1-29]